MRKKVIRATLNNDFECHPDINYCIKFAENNLK